MERPDKGRFRKGSEKRGHVQEHLWELREEFAIDMYFLHIVRKMINKNCASGNDMVLRSCGTKTEGHIL